MSGPLKKRSILSAGFPLRINESVLNAMQRWADDDLRSLSVRIVLRDVLVNSDKMKLVQKVLTGIVETENQESENTGKTEVESEQLNEPDALKN